MVFAPQVRSVNPGGVSIAYCSGFRNQVKVSERPIVKANARRKFHPAGARKWSHLSACDA